MAHLKKTSSEKQKFSLDRATDDDDDDLNLKENKTVGF